MKISIILPTIRKEKLLDSQLPSYVKQTFPKEEFEIIIIDDYVYSEGKDSEGKDRNGNRKDAILDFGNKNGLNIKWMRSKKSYYRSYAPIGNARNTGLIYAQGELIVFNDDFSTVRPNYLERVWNVYERNKNNGFGFSHIGPIITVDDNHELISIPEHLRYGVKENIYKTIYKEHRSSSNSYTDSCPGGWFYTSNASVPLDLIIKINGFWEIADLTREEDILMGLALERIGWKFCYIDDPDISVYCNVHHYPELDQERKKDKENKEDKEDKEDIQLVTKDTFNTQHSGSLALIEYFNRNLNLIFNKEETRTEKFDLKEERRKVKGEK